MKNIPTQLLRASLFAIASIALHAQDLARPGSPQVDTPIAFNAFTSVPSSNERPFDFTRAVLERDDLRPAADRSAPDDLIPRQGKSVATLLTGVPYAAIVEYAYGLTDRFSVGVIAGVLENSLPGYGVRLRYIVAQPSRDFRIHFRMPIIFYPQARSFGCPGCEAWFLAWPALNAEWRLDRGVRVWAGAGAVATACASTVFHTRNEEMESGEGVHEGAWNTFQLGFSKPLTRRVSFQLEAAAVMQGTKLATKTWVGGPPVILTTGFSYSF